MAWSTAGNLACRADHLREAYPGITLYMIGDTSHQASASDHNPDARSIVHAVDAMTYSDITRGNQITDWCLNDPTDLEYIIFNRIIYERDNGFRGSTYYGSNPHTDHVHISGKHGSVGYVSATGTGYDTAAENYRPEGLEDDVSAQEVWSYDVDPSGGTYSAAGGIWTTLNRAGYLANEFAPGVNNQLANMAGDIADIEAGLDGVKTQVAGIENQSAAIREVRWLLILVLILVVGSAVGVITWGATT